MRTVPLTREILGQLFAEFEEKFPTVKQWRKDPMEDVIKDNGLPVATLLRCHPDLMLGCCPECGFVGEAGKPCPKDCRVSDSTESETPRLRVRRLIGVDRLNDPSEFFNVVLETSITCKPVVKTGAGFEWVTACSNKVEIDPYKDDPFPDWTLHAVTCMACLANEGSTFAFNFGDGEPGIAIMNMRSISKLEFTR